MAKGSKYHLRTKRSRINHFESPESGGIDDILNLPLSEDYFDSISLKAAVWQYLMDHAKLADEGLLRVHTFIPNNEKAFWARVEARRSGRYKRTELFDFHEKAQKRAWYISQLKREKNYWERRQKILGEIGSNGTLKERLMIKVIRFLKRHASKLEKFVLKDKQNDITQGDKN